MSNKRFTIDLFEQMVERNEAKECRDTLTMSTESARKLLRLCRAAEWVARVGSSSLELTAALGELQ